MTGRKDLFEESMQLGNSAAWDLDWGKAIEHYRKALDEFPDSAEALVCLGLGQLETGDLKGALASYHRAAQADTADPTPLEKCAEIFEQLGQKKDAVEQRNAAAALYLKRQDIEKVLENWAHIARLLPENIDARMRLAMTYERMGRRAEAVFEFKAAASILQNAGNMDRAIEAIQRGLSLMPGDAEAINIFRMLRNGEPLPPPEKPRSVTGLVAPTEEEALLQAEEIGTDSLEDGPVDPEKAAQQYALAELASLLLETPTSEKEDDGKGSKVLSRLTTRVRGDKLAAASGHLNEGIELQSRGDKRDAAKEFQLALDAGFDQLSLRYVMGLLLKDIGEHDQARDHLLACLNDPDLALGANLALGRLARLSHDMEEAAHYLLQALRMADSLSVSDDQAEQLNKLYDSIMESQTEAEPRGIARIVENTLKFLSGPEWMQRIRRTREQLETQKPGEEVVPIAEMLVVGGSDSAMQALTRIDELVQRGMHKTAMEEAMLAISQSPNFLPLHTRMAEMMISSGRVEEGVNKLITIVDTYAVRGEEQKSAEILRRVLEYTPVNVDNRTKLINLLIQTDRLDEALDQYLELAEIHRQMAQIDEARKVLAGALKLAQDINVEPTRIVQILHQIGDIDLARLDLRQGVQIYEEIRNLDLNDEIAWAQLVELNLRLGQEGRAARELDGYLDLLVKSGKGNQALEVLEQLVRDFPGKQSLHARLGEAYRVAGRKADAITQFDTLGDIQLDADQIQEAIQTIRIIVEMGPPDVEGYLELLRNLESGK
ncbi:MAG TPA: tetratricopeptide repeat protein [Anaerolineae bacterium]|nr:tetratricopeptide repeat protein [Anaerolineae bacterium]